MSLRDVTANFNYGLSLDEYSEKYSHCLIFDREDGILTVRTHTDGGRCHLTLENHHAIGQAWVDIGRDPENEVVIVTGTDGDFFDINEHLADGTFPNKCTPDDVYQISYSDTMWLFEKFLFNIEVPTIAALCTSDRTPVAHVEVPYVCDIVLCSEATTFGDIHFSMPANPGMGIPCGDGQALALEELIGHRRMSYLAYTGEFIDAQKALEWGIVNEVLPQDEVLPRAKELARKIIASAPSISRKLQAQLVKRPWKQRLVNDLQNHISHEMFAIMALSNERKK
jgi:Enoyl-CoA hydratase/carnithine racemase